jgi:4-diphosphocytidyl-2-C-methyl-D-erythritol kinase
MPTRVRSFSKINLGLFVGPARPDGFHSLVTVYQTLEAHDFVTVTARPSTRRRITITANHPGVPSTARGDAEKNTAFQIVDRALALTNQPAEVDIAIDKRLPIQGGIGAGSGNAAAALIALEAELGKFLSHSRLELAAEVGSDVPLFFLGGTSLGTDRGQVVTPLPDLKSTFCVLAIPSVGVSTAQAFRDIDAKMAAEVLKNGPEPDRLNRLSRILSNVFATSGLNDESGRAGIDLPETWGKMADLAADPLRSLVRTGIENDFEEVAFSQHPSLREIKQALVGSHRSEAVYAALSGSGSTLFGLYDSEAAAHEAQHRVQHLGTWTVLTRILPRNEYWYTMFAK